MKAEDANYFWSFTKPLEDSSVIKCHNCEVFTPLADWKESYVFCDLCGDHPAIVCPHCLDHHDHVWCDPFEVQ